MRRNYVQQSINLLKVSISVIEDILKTKNIEREFSEPLKTNVEDYKDSKKRCEMLIGISKTNYSKLYHLEIYEKSKLAFSKNKELAKKIGVESEYGDYVKEIPSIVREDPEKLWLYYLEAVNEMIKKF